MKIIRPPAPRVDMTDGIVRADAGVFYRLLDPSRVALITPEP